MDTETTTRDAILRKGAELIHRKGYNGTGLKEILERAGVPRGSFYFYFRSKEDFGIEVIDYFTRIIEGVFRKHLGDESTPALNRLSGLVDFYGGFLEKQGYTFGCPIGNLSLEMAGTNERFRKRLESSIAGLIGLIEQCVSAAQEEKAVNAEINTSDAAHFIFYGFEGALLHAKVLRNTAPLKQFRECLFMYLTGTKRGLARDDSREQ